MTQNHLKMDKKNIYLTESLSGLIAGKRIEANSFQEAEKNALMATELLENLFVK